MRSIFTSAAVAPIRPAAARNGARNVLMVICFVSANTWDAQAAAQFGFQAVRVDRFGLNDDNIPGKPAALIKDLSELAAMV